VAVLLAEVRERAGHDRVAAGVADRRVAGQAVDTAVAGARTAVAELGHRRLNTRREQAGPMECEVGRLDVVEDEPSGSHDVTRST
jgi:hypothetical protein